MLTLFNFIPRLIQSLTFYGGSGGGGSTSPQIPQYVQDYQKNIFNLAQGIALDPQNPLKARQFAGFSPDQYKGMDYLRGTALGEAGTATIDQAANRMAGLTNYTPMNVSGTSFDAASINRKDIRDVLAKNFLQGNMSGYMNPYTSQVIDTSMADIDRARQLQQQQVNAQAASRGAYGGSRQAIAEAENSRNYLDQQARTIAQLRNQGFDTAAALMGRDFDRDLQAQVSNQGVDYNVGAQNAGFLQGARQFAAQAEMQARLANQAAGLQANAQNIGATSQLGALGQSQQDSRFKNAQALMGIGEMQQNLEQQRLDAERNLPLERLGVMQAAFSGSQLPYGQSMSAQRGNPIGGALGGAATGAAIGSAVPGVGTAVGAGVGGVLGLFSR